jgi:hypothetical protein
MHEEKFGGSNNASYLVPGNEAAPAIASSGTSNSDRDLIRGGLVAANHDPRRSRERIFHTSLLGGTFRSHKLRIDVQKIVHLCFHRSWSTITIHAARVPMPIRYDAISPELRIFGLAPKPFPKTTPKKPQGIALISVT